MPAQGLQYRFSREKNVSSKVLIDGERATVQIKSYPSEDQIPEQSTKEGGTLPIDAVGQGTTQNVLKQKKPSHFTRQTTARNREKGGNIDEFFSAYRQRWKKQGEFSQRSIKITASQKKEGGDDLRSNQ